MMGRGGLEAAKVLVEELQLPLTAEEVVKISRDKLLEQFPSALLLPGEKIYLFFCYECINSSTYMWYVHVTYGQDVDLKKKKIGVMVKIYWICITYF